MESTRLIGSVLASLRRDRRFSSRDYQRFQSRKLGGLLSHARRHVPFHRDRWGDLVGETPELELIPPTDKAEMMGRFDETIAGGIVTRAEIDREAVRADGELPVLHGRYLISRTSGTTGKPGVFVNDLSDWTEIRGMVFARTMRDRMTFKQIAPYFLRAFRIGYLVSGYRYGVSWQSAELARRRSKPFVKVEIFQIEDPVERNIAGLCAFRPDYLHAYPTALEGIAHRKLGGERIPLDPEVISLGGEPTSPAAKRVILEAFPGAVHSNLYGASECLALGSSCSAGRLHLNPDAAFIEPRDEAGNPAAPGELSDHILLTNLVNRTQPIIRYRIDDSLRVFSDPCPCGRPTPTVEIEGRRTNHFYLIDNGGEFRRISALSLVAAALDFSERCQNQLTHVHQNEIECRAVFPIGDGRVPLAREIRRTLLDFLKTHNCDRTTSVRVKFVDELERTGSGQKLQQIVSEVEPPREFRIVA